MDALSRLQTWYAAQCDGNWEHQEGIRIETLDNPGWRVTINLTGTALEGRPFTEVAVGVGADAHPASPRWMHRWSEDGLWQAATDERRLAHVLELFLDWAGVSAATGAILSGGAEGS